MISTQQQATLFSSGLFIGALVLATALQLTTITNLNAKVVEQQKQVNGITAFNQTLQHKMLLMRTEQQDALYRQFMSQLPQTKKNQHLAALNLHKNKRG
ncbi:MAG: hypothetical protein MJK04_00925 [Psychrosphaera sp.]|nr:hypothetical protein [Psychrosphaera sp.]